MDIAALIIGAIGALAWIPWLFDKLQPVKIYGKMNSLTVTHGQKYSYLDLEEQKRELKGIGYFIKLSVTALNKTFNLKKLEVYVKYPDDEKTRQGKIFWVPSMETSLDGQRYRLQIPSAEYISFINVLEEGKVNSCYIMFVVDKANFKKFSEMEFRFFNYKGKYKTLTISRSEIDPTVMLFEKNLWTPIE